MDRRERAGEAQTTLLAAFMGMQAGLWTAIPATVLSFDAAKQTCSAQPMIQARVLGPTGAWSWVTLPVLVDCPAFFPSGGGATLTFPVRAGDECLVVFSSRCIDSWWQNGPGPGANPEAQPQAELRMHDLSDGFCFVGVSSLPRVVADISTSEVQLRSDDGLAMFAMNPTTGALKIIAPGGLTIVGDVTLTGAMAASGDVTAEGKSVAHHTHTQPNDSHGDQEMPTNEPS